MFPEDFLITNPNLLKQLSISDLHLHTFYSDGTITPEDLVKQARETKYKLISIADHNSIESYTPEIFSLCKDLGIDIIPGVEMDCGNGLDILVYDQEVNRISDGFFKSFTTITKRENFKRLEAVKKSISEIIYYLKNSKDKYPWIRWDKWDNSEKQEFLGFFTIENIAKVNLKTGELNIPSRTYISKPHIATILNISGLIDTEMLMKLESLPDKKSAYRKMRKIFFTEITKWSYDNQGVDTELIKELKELGFLMILAHPDATFSDFQNIDFTRETDLGNFTKEIVETYNLDGAECEDHSGINKEIDYNQIIHSALFDIANNCRLIYGTAGSDRHDGFV
jgi:hypothetical protein